MNATSLYDCWTNCKSILECNWFSFSQTKESCILFEDVVSFNGNFGTYLTAQKACSIPEWYTNARQVTVSWFSEMIWATEQSIIKFSFLTILRTFQNTQFLIRVQKIDPSIDPKWKLISLCKGGIRNIFAFMIFFGCLIKFWSLPYGPKAQWANYQKAKLIGFF